MLWLKVVPAKHVARVHCARITYRGKSLHYAAGMIVMTRSRAGQLGGIVEKGDGTLRFIEGGAVATVSVSLAALWAQQVGLRALCACQQGAAP